MGGQPAGRVCVAGEGVTIFYHVWLCLSFLIDPHEEQEYLLLRDVLRFEGYLRVRD